MGFTITSSVTLPGLKLTLTGLYVSISGGYKVIKIGTDASPLYIINAPYYVSTSKGAQILSRSIVMISVTVVPENVYEALYIELKAKFPDATFVDN